MIQQPLSAMPFTLSNMAPNYGNFSWCNCFWMLCWGVRTPWSGTQPQAQSSGQIWAGYKSDTHLGCLCATGACMTDSLSLSLRGCVWKLRNLKDKRAHRRGKERERCKVRMLTSVPFINWVIRRVPMQWKFLIKWASKRKAACTEQWMDCGNWKDC